MIIDGHAHACGDYLSTEGILRLLDALGVDKVVLAVSYLKDWLQAYFETNDVGMEVVLVEEKDPLELGGQL